MWPAPQRAAAAKLCRAVACTPALRRGLPALAHRARCRSQAGVCGPCISRAAHSQPLARDAPDDGAVFVQRVAQLHPRLARRRGRRTRAETAAPARGAHAVGWLRRLGAIGLRLRHAARDRATCAPRPARRSGGARDGWRCADRWVKGLDCQLRGRAPASLNGKTRSARTHCSSVLLRHGIAHRFACLMR